MPQDVIRAIRRRLGMNQTTFAKQFGVDQTTVSQYETGKAKPSAQQLIKILSLAENESESAPILKSLEEEYGLLIPDVAMLVPQKKENPTT